MNCIIAMNMAKAGRLLALTHALQEGVTIAEIRGGKHHAERERWVTTEKAKGCHFNEAKAAYHAH